MNEDFNEKLQAILNNPDMMQKISAIANSFSSETPKPPPEKEQRHETAAPAGLFKTPENKTPAIDPRISLLHSIKPFLQEERRSKVDLLAKAVSMAGLLDLFKDKK